MNLALKRSLFAAAFATIACVVSTESADAGNGWRWAKPLNKKTGSLFYTTNRNVNSRGFRSRSRVPSRVYSSRSYRWRTSVPPTSQVWTDNAVVKVYAAPTTPILNQSPPVDSVSSSPPSEAPPPPPIVAQPSDASSLSSPVKPTQSRDFQGK